MTINPTNTRIECPACGHPVALTDKRIYLPALCVGCGEEIPRARTSGRNPKFCAKCKSNMREKKS